jgi:hypothetical protein
MATYKRIAGDYTLQSIGGNVTILGNLTVTGTQTTVASTNTAVDDNIITLNKGEAGAGVTAVYAGIEIDRGSSNTTSIRWNESVKNWQLTVDGTSFSNVATSGGGTTANIDLGGYTIYSSTGPTVTLDDNVAIVNTTVAPNAVANYNIVYSQTPGGGGSGLYVVNSSTPNQELATQAAAIKYSIIFG